MEDSSSFQTGYLEFCKLKIFAVYNDQSPWTKQSRQWVTRDFTEKNGDDNYFLAAFADLLGYNERDVITESVERTYLNRCRWM